MVIYCGKDYEGIQLTNDKKKCKKKQLSHSLPFKTDTEITLKYYN
jgi:hypothetical protein